MVLTANVMYLIATQLLVYVYLVTLVSWERIVDLNAHQTAIALHSKLASTVNVTILVREPVEMKPLVL